MKRLFPDRFVSIRTKIILPFLLIAIALSIAAGYMAWQVASDSIQERFVNQLIEVGKLANEGMVRQEDRMLETLRLLANTNGVPQAIINQDATGLRNLALPLAVNSSEEAIIFLGIDGVSVLSMYHRPGGPVEEYIYNQGDEQFRSWQIVQRVIQNLSDSRGNKFAAFHKISLGNYFFICGPVLDENQVMVGAILVGRTTDRLVQELREETLAQITLYDTLGNPIATTFFESPELGPLTSLDVVNKQDDESVIRELVISDIQYNEILGAWNARGETMGVMGESFSQKFLVRMGRSTWLRAFTLVMVATLLVIAVGVFTSNIISQPILRLKKAASSVAEGNLEVKILSTGHDEIARLTQEFNSMVKRLQKARSDLISAYDSTIEGWAKTLEARDHETLGHSHRVVNLTIKLARAMSFPEEHIVHIRRGAFLHDIGKLTIPDNILKKTGPLTADEWVIVKKHPKAAYEFLKGIDFLEKAINIPYCHHEHWDGSGYPRGLKGTDIPLEARIFTVVDTYDAIRSDRPYKQARRPEEAFRELRIGKGILYDPEVVDTFLKLMREDGDDPAS